MASLPSYSETNTPSWTFYKLPTGAVQFCNQQRITKGLLPQLLIPINAISSQQNLNRPSFVVTNTFVTSPTQTLNINSTTAPQTNLQTVSFPKPPNIVRKTNAENVANILKAFHIPKYPIRNKLLLSSSTKKKSLVQCMTKARSVTIPAELLTPETARYMNPFEYNENTMDSPNLSQSLLEDKDSAPKKLQTWLCLICSEEKDSKEDLIAHYEDHKQQGDNLEIDKNDSENEELQCPICCNVYSDLQSYKLHVLKIHKSREYYCEICNKNFTNAFLLSSHNRQHAEDKETLICVVCKTFTTISCRALMNHIRNIHEKSMFFCQECGKYFTSSVWFKEHKIFHKEFDLFSCKHCKQNFKNKRLLIGHMKKVHKIESSALTKYKCDICGWTFPFEIHMKKHTLYYHKTSSFLCNICGKTFARRDLLNIHMANHNEKKFKCITCEKSFHKKHSLNQHVLIHTGKKPHKCHLCEKSFSQRTPLVIHIRTHTGERPYTCPSCGKGFVAKTPRDSHQKRCNLRKLKK